MNFLSKGNIYGIDSHKCVGELFESVRLRLWFRWGRCCTVDNDATCPLLLLIDCFSQGIRLEWVESFRSTILQEEQMLFILSWWWRRRGIFVCCRCLSLIWFFCLFPFLELDNGCHSESFPVLLGRMKQLKNQNWTYPHHGEKLFLSSRIRQHHVTIVLFVVLDFSFKFH